MTAATSDCGTSPVAGPSPTSSESWLRRAGDSELGDTAPSRRDRLQRPNGSGSGRAVVEAPARRGALGRRRTRARCRAGQRCEIHCESTHVHRPRRGGWPHPGRSRVTTGLGDHGPPTTSPVATSPPPRRIHSRPPSGRSTAWPSRRLAQGIVHAGLTTRLDGSRQQYELRERGYRVTVFDAAAVRVLNDDHIEPGRDAVQVVDVEFVTRRGCTARSAAATIATAAPSKGPPSG